MRVPADILLPSGAADNDLLVYSSSTGHWRPTKTIGALTMVGAFAHSGGSFAADSPSTIALAAATSLTMTHGDGLGGGSTGGHVGITSSTTGASVLRILSTNPSAESVLQYYIDGAATAYIESYGTTTFDITTIGASRVIRLLPNSGGNIALLVSNSLVRAIGGFQCDSGTFYLSGSGGASEMRSTSAGLTISTITSGDLALVSAGALNATGVGASTFSFSGGAFILQATGVNLGIRTVTSGALAITSAGGVTISAAATGTLSYSATARFAWDGTGLAFYGAGTVAQQTVTGSRGGNAALADLLIKLANTGLLVDGTSA